MNQCKIANYDLIITALLLFALTSFKDPQQCNHPPIWVSGASRVDKV